MLVYLEWKNLKGHSTHSTEKAVAPHSSVLAWRIPGTGEPGGLSSMGLHRVGHDWSELAAAVHILKEIYMVFLFIYLRGLVPYYFGALL